MYSLKDVVSIQLEISTYCNAACPQCPRNFFGGKTIPDLPLRAWTLDDVKNLFTLDFLHQLKQIYLCGTYGDPMTNSHVVRICEFFKNNNPDVVIGIHTNGAAGTDHVYAALAKTVDFIAFGIDGLEDTNSIYRRQVSWKKLMRNSKAFIDAGGCAIWDFIVFEHNQHQIDQARVTSADLGFKEFCVKKTSRFINRAHQIQDHLDVVDTKGFVQYKIRVPTDPSWVNEGYQHLKNITRQEFNTHLTGCEIKCNADQIKEIYIGADGFVFPCGWLHDRLYGPEITGHSDYFGIKELMAAAGGWTVANAFYTPLQTIVDGAWFRHISQSWSNTNRLERCAMMCGSGINVIGPQNSQINYKE